MVPKATGAPRPIFHEGPTQVARGDLSTVPSEIPPHLRSVGSVPMHCNRNKGVCIVSDMSYLVFRLL